MVPAATIFKCIVVADVNVAPPLTVRIAAPTSPLPISIVPPLALSGPIVAFGVTKIPVPTPELVKAQAPPKTPAKYVCPSCKAEFGQPLKFCGECGKPMKAAQA